MKINQLIFNLVLGMNIDLGQSKRNTKYANRILNMRCTIGDSGTLLEWTNEKGTKEVPFTWLLSGENIVAYCIINKYIVFFVSGTIDKIYRCTFDGLLHETLIAKGKFNFNSNYKDWETLASYENETVLKVFWIDGINQLRFINILTDTIEETKLIDTIPCPDKTLKLSVTRDSGGGFFKAGTIQYYVTLYNLHGALTNICYSSSILYISSENRGGKVDESINCKFTLNITGIDTSFDYLRIYSVTRTSTDTEPSCNIIADIPITDNNISYTDYNQNLVSFPYSTLAFMNNSAIIPSTMAAKDNTLFLGNYHYESVKDVKYKEKLASLQSDSLPDSLLSFKYSQLNITKDSDNSQYYPYENQLVKGSKDILGFKGGETYYFGIILLDKSYRWSSVIYLGSKKNTLYPQPENNMIVQALFCPFLIMSLLGELASDIINIKVLFIKKDESLRDVVCLGIVCPTVYSLEERINGTAPFALASWFFRPEMTLPPTEYNDKNIYNESTGGVVEFRHYRPLRLANDSDVSGAEIQLSPKVGTNEFELWLMQKSLIIDGENTQLNNENLIYKRLFGVDNQIVTFHSPDIEFNDTVRTVLDASTDYKFRIIGRVQIQNTISDCLVTLEKENFTNKDANKAYRTITGFNKLKLLYNNGNKAYTAWYGAMTTCTAIDGDNIEGFAEKHKVQSYFPVFAWNRSTSINELATPVGEYTWSAPIKNKIISNIRYCKTFYDAPNTYWIPANGISDINIWDETTKLIKIKGDNNPIETEVTYYGSVDTVLTSPKYWNKRTLTGQAISEGVRNEDSYRFVGWDKDSKKILWDTYSEGDTDKFKYFVDPVRMKYNSTPHAVFSFGWCYSDIFDQYIQTILPNIGQSKAVKLGVGYTLPWGKEGVNVNSLSVLYDKNDKDGILFLGEFYKYDNNLNTSDFALSNYTWIEASEQVSINTNTITLFGDTYCQRYDCLKTYAANTTDVNLVVDIASFMCETYINIDGRCDRNRGNLSNLYVDNTNFNLINKAYTQLSQSRQTYILDNLFPDMSFPNQLTYTLSKTSGESIDSWTALDGVSTLDFDGSKGSLNKLYTWLDKIYFFQDTGMGIINFNSNSLISPELGLPIQLANTGKVEGKVYISEKIGCKSKHSVNSTLYTLYFIDANTRDIYKLNTDGLTSLSEGTIASWLKNFDVTESSTFVNLDKKDIYFVFENSLDYNCITYNETIGSFISFYNYSPEMMFNYNDNYFLVKLNKLWLHNQGEYNTFYGNTVPYFIEFISTGDGILDKIYNTVEYRADVFENNEYQPDDTFDTFEISTEYQQASMTLIDNHRPNSNLRKRFRTWRLTIPRSNGTRDRFRNPWVKFSLKKIHPNKEKMVVRDVIITYFD